MTTSRDTRSARYSAIYDSSSPYYVDFPDHVRPEAVYFQGYDEFFGPIVAVIYKSTNSPKGSLSSIFISRHGTSGFLNMTLTPKSRFFGACENLIELHQRSLVRRALAITCLRAFATMDNRVRQHLLSLAGDNGNGSVQNFDWDETTSGALASSMTLMTARFPEEIGDVIAKSGAISPKYIRNTVVDVVYEDSDDTIEDNNDLVYLLGNQLEQLFDPYNEYSPEPTEKLYVAPVEPPKCLLKDETLKVKSICEELYQLQNNFRGGLVSFLEHFLVPLRVKVLDGQIPGMTIRKLNTIFPPTVDEILRVNTLLLEALEESLPYGSLEVVKACGMLIPYFYKACMRHEAASKNFARNLNYHYPTLEKHYRKFSVRKIENIIHCSLHLTKIKLVLDRLMESKLATHEWSLQEQTLANQYYQSAVGTIDAFGKATNVAAYDRRVFTPTGKILVEVAKNWPKALEYGWINRRVISIFHGSSILDKDVDKNHIIILFTDYVVVLKKSAESLGGPTKSEGNNTADTHTPSIADRLMHSMVNEMPLSNIPELEVVGYCPVDDVAFAEHTDRSLMMLTKDESLSYLIYDLTEAQKDLTSGNIVELHTKARIMNKTQPFHLFKAESSDFRAYATVHELQGYLQEVHKGDIALFLNINVGPEILDANHIQACLNVMFLDEPQAKERQIRILAYTKLGYGFDKTVRESEFRATILAEIAYIQTLCVSVLNEDWRPHLIKSNEAITKFLVKYGTTPSPKKLKQTPDRKPSIQRQTVVVGDAIELLTNQSLTHTTSPTDKYFKYRLHEEEKDFSSHDAYIRHKPPSLNNLYSVQHDVQRQRQQQGEEEEEEEEDLDESDSTTPYFKAHSNNLIYSSDSPYGSTGSMLSAIPSPTRAPSLSLSPTPSADHVSFRANKAQKSVTHMTSRYGNLASDDEDYVEWEDVSDTEERDEQPQARTAVDGSLELETDSDYVKQQRDVEEWYKSLDKEEGDLDSLSSYESDLKDSLERSPEREVKKNHHNKNEQVAIQIGNIEMFHPKDVGAGEELQHVQQAQRRERVLSKRMSKPYNSGNFSGNTSGASHSASGDSSEWSEISQESISLEDVTEAELQDTLLLDEHFSYLAEFM